MPHSTQSRPYDIVVVAASAGGVEALIKLVSSLPGDLGAAVFVLLHLSDSEPSMLPRILSRRAILPVSPAIDGRSITPGHVWVAVPGRHLALEPGVMRLLPGPRENGHRPSGDVLFHTAASSYGSGVIGVVLSGADDDGAAGLVAIKEAGGLAIVQDPNDALYPRMPQSSLDAVKVDHCLPVKGIGPLLGELCPAHSALREEEKVQHPKDLTPDEQRSPTRESDDYQKGTPAAYTCPECHGTLWEVDEGEVVRFRCRVGHGFTAEHLMAGQAHNVEAALWMALRTLEERAQLSDKMSKRARKHGLSHAAKRFDETSREAKQAADTLRALLTNGHSEGPSGERVTENVVAEFQPS